MFNTNVAFVRGTANSFLLQLQSRIHFVHMYHTWKGKRWKTSILHQEQTNIV